MRDIHPGGQPTPSSRRQTSITIQFRCKLPALSQVSRHVRLRIACMERFPSAPGLLHCVPSKRRRRKSTHLPLAAGRTVGSGAVSGSNAHDRLIRPTVGQQIVQDEVCRSAVHVLISEQGLVRAKTRGLLLRLRHTPASTPKQGFSLSKQSISRT